METVALTGANRGLGLEFARQLLRRGDRVFAGCRAPEAAEELAALTTGGSGRLTILPLDVASDASVEAFAAAVGEATSSLDLLINNAGVMPRFENPRSLDSKEMLGTFAVNSVGPMLLARRFLPLLEASSGPKPPRIANISSQLGSLERKETGGFYSYCASKAALNMLTRALAFDLKRQGILVTAFHPGWVRTDMGGRRAPLTPEQAADGLLRVMDSLSEKDSGGFLTWEGEEHPW